MNDQTRLFSVELDVFELGAVEITPTQRDSI